MIRLVSQKVLDLAIGLAPTGTTTRESFQQLTVPDPFLLVFPLGAKSLAVVTSTDIVAEVAEGKTTAKNLSNFKPPFSAF